MLGARSSRDKRPSYLALALRAAWVVLLGSVLLPGCSSSSVSIGRFQVVPAFANLVVRQLGALPDVVARCPTGEEVLGGGYSIVGGGSFLGGESPPIVITASYPHLSPPNAFADGWIVRARNPDSSTGGPNWEAMVIAQAYCLATANYPLSMVSVQQQYAIQTNSRDYPEYGRDLTAQCPAGGTLTAGGFRVEGQETDPFNYLSNDDVFGSTPLLSGSTPVGWRVREWTQTQSLTVWVYALCALQNLPASSVMSVTVPFPSPAASQFRQFDGSVACAPDQVSTGGGFDFPNDNIDRGSQPYPLSLNPFEEYPDTGRLGTHLIPYGADESRAVVGLDGWILDGFHGRDFRREGEFPTSLARVWVVCVQAPSRLLDPEVQIVAPPNTSNFPVASGSTQTALITFTATATDSSGRPLTGQALQWTQSTGGTPPTPLGTGATFQQSLPGIHCRLESHTVSVVATDDRGRSATASIIVTTGGQSGCHS